MLELRYARAWRVASITLLLGVLAATLMPAIWFDSSRIHLANADKWSHMMAFLVLTVWFAGLYHRSAEWLDLAADAAGIVAGLGVAWVGAGGWCQRIETWLAARAG